LKGSQLIARYAAIGRAFEQAGVGVIAFRRCTRTCTCGGRFGICPRSVGQLPAVRVTLDRSSRCLGQGRVLKLALLRVNGRGREGYSCP
jgi:hypothetical protein